MNSLEKFVLNIIPTTPYVVAYDNTIDPFIPEIWAQESLAILEENMIAGALVHRDFENEFARFGDLVHTRRPGEFIATRKTTTDSVTVQDSTATDVQVPLNQHIHVSFLIRDGEETQSFKDLIEVYMAPAMLAQARVIDQIVLGQYPQFIQNCYGRLGQLTAMNAVDFLTGTRNVMNVNKAYMNDRQFILTPNTETQLLQLPQFTQAQKVGDDGFALREAWLGRKYGFNMYMCQNMAGVSTGNTVATGAINNASGYAVGATTLTIDGFSAAIAVNSFITIAGDDTPQRVVSTTGGSTPTQVVVYPGLLRSVTDNAVVTSYTPGTVNNSGGYASGWSKPIAFSGFSVNPQVGQMVSFQSNAPSGSELYTIIQVDSGASTILLDRPLDITLSNSDKINIGPAGQYNLAFHRNAIALVVRPLAMPKPGTGALSAVVNHNDLSMRATITYDGNKQGHLVTLDMLCGIAILDEHLGAVMLG